MDSELDAMRKISEALAGLEPPTRQRVLSWAGAKFGCALQQPTVPGRTEERVPAPQGDEFQDFASLFYAANPETNAERALVAAKWLAGGQSESFQGQALNSLLKDLGFQLANITDALSQNMREKPALVVQIKKAGNTRQARKSYKLTDAGLRKVREMIRANSNGEANG